MSITPIVSDLNSTAGATLTNPRQPNANVACPASTSLSAFLSGTLETALGEAPAAGDVFILTASQDTSDTAFATAKGSAPAVGDEFQVTGSGTTIEFVKPVLVSDGFGAIAAYLSVPPNTQAARSNILPAIQCFNELVALVNAVAAT